MTQPGSAPLNDPPRGEGADEAAAVGPVAIPLTPRVWNEAWKAPFLEIYARVRNVSQAARACGISRDNVYYAINSSQVFAEAFEEAKSVSDDLLRQIAHQRATTGQPRRRVVTKRKRDQQGNVIEEETTEMDETVFDNVLLHRVLQAWVPEFAATGDAPPARGPVEVIIYRHPTRERTLELLRLGAELEAGRRPAELPVIDAIVVQAPEEDEEPA